MIMKKEINSSGKVPNKSKKFLLIYTQVSYRSARIPGIFTTNHIECVFGKKFSKKPDYPEELTRRLIRVNILNSLIKFSIKKTSIEKITNMKKDRIIKNKKVVIEEGKCFFGKRN